MAFTSTEYAVHLRERGTPSIVDAHSRLWVRTARGAYTRVPVFEDAPVEGADLAALWRGHAVLADYVTAPTPAAPANAIVYLRQAPYGFDELPSAMRRNLRRGLAELTFADISHADIARLGEKSFCDTRSRNGLSDGNPEAFRKHLARVTVPEVRFIGAFHDGNVIAYLRVLRVDNWVEIQPYSANDGLEFRPNDTLLFKALDDFLGDPTVATVTYGLSSVQRDETDDGLHRFKLKVGFRAVPVRRVFVAHPVVRPLATAARLGATASRRLAPANVSLRKAEGALMTLTGTVERASTQHEGVTVRDATARDEVAITKLIYDRDHFSATGELALRVAGQLAATDTRVAERDGAVVGAVRFGTGGVESGSRVAAVLRSVALEGVTSTLRDLRGRATRRHARIEVPDGCFEIRDVHVNATVRGQGIGSLLLDDVEQVARSLGANRLALLVRADNPARRLYERHGLAVTAQQDEPGVAARLLMEKSLS